MFVVCGEALFDVFATGETPTGMSLDARVGGSPFNLATGLARMGQPVGLLTQISNGFLGECLMRALASEGVDTGAVQRSDAPTTISLIGLNVAGVPSYAFYGEGCADRRLTLEALNAVPASTHALCFGSYATVVGETASTQRLLIERWRNRALIVYDPNIRLNVQPDVDVWREQMRWMLSRTDLLKVSDEDLALIEPGLPADDFARAALNQGVTLVVVTRGAQGAVAWTAGHRLEVPSVPVTVVDTVGAGDSFQAAMLTWLAERNALSSRELSGLSMAELRELVEFAARAAGITCTRRGADLPLRSDVCTA
jgi:fructokinase